MNARARRPTPAPAFAALWWTLAGACTTPQLVTVDAGMDARTVEWGPEAGARPDRGEETPSPADSADAADDAVAPSMDARVEPDAGEDAAECPDGGLRCGFACTDPRTDPLNCGTCGSVCPITHACSDGACVLSCTAPAVACGNRCADTLRDPDHCGGCGHACSAGEDCVGGACVPRCTAPLAECRGACVDLSTNDAHCGACGAACPAGSVCVAGACVTACPSGETRCGGSCSNLGSNPAHCGACGHACAGTEVCVSGTCAAACSPPRTTCGAACVDTASDARNCGSCGVACGAGERCNGGRCVSLCSGGATPCPASTPPGFVCADTALDPTNCGGCGNVCGPGRTCAGGRCTLICPTGQTACGTRCATLASDVANCGACDHACASGELCVGGVCTPPCGAGQTLCGSTCRNLLTDATSCGACGTACAAPNASGLCESGRCRLSCTGGYGDCDGNPANGCETNRMTSPDHCGACGAACPSRPNATRVCVSGVCGIQCAAGFGDCDGNPFTGCETSTSTELFHCGACNRPCSAPPGAIARCAAGTCTFDCAPGRGNCDGNAVNGCEVALNTLSNCGACGMQCAQPQNGVPTCDGTACGVQCNAGFGNCDANAANGCEINLMTNPDRCGACNATPCAFANAVGQCSAGRCALGTCTSPYGNCDGNAANGCETDVRGDVNHCGGCGRMCLILNGTASCTNGACGVLACNAGHHACGLVCVPNTAVAACGSSCTPCPAPANGTATCDGTACGIACNAGYHVCGSLCSADTSAASCGSACTPCQGGSNATPACVVGASGARECGLACNAGWGDCDGIAANGCETSVPNNPSHCGRCGNACPAPDNATATCSSGTCGFTCNAGFADCNGDATDGCEVNTATSTANCGGCGIACGPTTNGAPTCTAGRCTISCVAGFGDCDGIYASGCETDLATDVRNCGACGIACGRGGAQTWCASAVCQYSCLTGYADCDGSATNGCEVNTRNDRLHCGSCTTTCAAPTGACNNRSCTAGPPNDGFATAAVLPGQTTTAEAITHGTLVSATADYPGGGTVPCVTNGTSQVNVWYRFPLSTRSIVYLDTSGSEADTVLTLWNPNALSQPLQCNNDSGCPVVSGSWNATTNSRVVSVLQPLTGMTIPYYYVSVAADGATGGFTLRAQIIPLTRYPGLNATPLTVGSWASFSGQLLGASQTAGTCGGDGSAEDVRWFTSCGNAFAMFSMCASDAVAGGTPTWTRAATVSGVSRTYDPALYLRSGADGTEIGCNDDGGSLGGTQCAGTGGDTSPWGSRLLTQGLSRGLNFVFADERNASGATLPNEGMSFTVGYLVTN